MTSEKNIVIEKKSLHYEILYSVIEHFVVHSNNLTVMYHYAVILCVFSLSLWAAGNVSHCAFVTQSSRQT